MYVLALELFLFYHINNDDIARFYFLQELGKGKTKVNGVGKGSAEKIFEFLTTGSIAKLDEKRANKG